MNAAAVTIAKKEIADASRSKLLWGAIAVLLVVTIPDFTSMIGTEIIDSAAEATRFVPAIFVNFVAPIAMIAVHRAVVGERESGSLRLLLGQPASRRDIVLGKAIGRAVVVAMILLVAALGIGATIVAAYGTLPITLFTAIAAYTMLYGVVWSGLTVGISAGVSSRLQAITGVLGLFFFFGPFRIWDQFVVPIIGSAFGSTPVSWTRRVVFVR